MAQSHKRGRSSGAAVDEPLDLQGIHEAYCVYLAAEIKRDADEHNYELVDYHEITGQSQEFTVVADTSMGNVDESPVFEDNDDSFTVYVFMHPRQYELLRRTHVSILQYRWAEHCIASYTPPRGANPDGYSLKVRIRDAKIDVSPPDSITLTLLTDCVLSAEFFHGKDVCRHRAGMMRGKRRIRCAKDDAVRCTECYARIACSKCALIEPLPVPLCGKCERKAKK
jgi:hypothetical protein